MDRFQSLTGKAMHTKSIFSTNKKSFFKLRIARSGWEKVLNIRRSLMTGVIPISGSQSEYQMSRSVWLLSQRISYSGWSTIINYVKSLCQKVSFFLGLILKLFVPWEMMPTVRPIRDSSHIWILHKGFCSMEVDFGLCSCLTKAFLNVEWNLGWVSSFLCWVGISLNPSPFCWRTRSGHFYGCG